MLRRNARELHQAVRGVVMLLYYSVGLQPCVAFLLWFVCMGLECPHAHAIR